MKLKESKGNLEKNIKLSFFKEEAVLLSSLAKNATSCPCKKPIEIILQYTIKNYFCVQYHQLVFKHRT